MTERSTGEGPSPLPRDWLPEAAPPEGAPEWDSSVARIVNAADPALRRLGNARTEVTWVVGLGAWWRPAAALAAGAAALLLVLESVQPNPTSDEGSLPLSVVAADGDPVGIWVGLGVEADPVLALIALQQQAR